MHVGLETRDSRIAGNACKKVQHAENRKTVVRVIEKNAEKIFTKTT